MSDRVTPTDDTEQEQVRGTEVVVILERDDDGVASETIERRVSREMVTKVEYRNKSKQNPVWDWNGTIKIDLSEEGLRGERKGIIDVKYIEGGVFVDPESDGDQDE